MKFYLDFLHHCITDRKLEICFRNIFTYQVIILLIFMVTVTQNTVAENNTSYISFENKEGSFPLSVSGRVTPLCISSKDYPGVLRVLKHLQADIGLVTNKQPDIYVDHVPEAKEIVFVGTIGKSPLIEKLIDEKKLDVAGITGKWEMFLIQQVKNPLPGIDRGLVITGSDKRGTIYGMYNLSKQIGVSPWYWWADVPVKYQSNLYVLPGSHTIGEPAVKYRGIFINDEAPALSRWVWENYGNYNHHFYEKVFELILRLNGNYLWPAMWGNAFNDDDPLNSVLADEYGIVMGTSHHEPMARSQKEWQRFGKGKWDYRVNKENMQEFWRQGIKNMGSRESIVTIGMRGDGDVAMSEKSDITLLVNIVEDQRKILAEVTGKEPSAIPQLWALYKEVQDYYDNGMRVPEDVTLLLCDDNWGNIRKLPEPGEKARSGGYGIYYHFDYVGGPRSYKWLNTNTISKIWEQMNLAYRHGVDRIWIVNVGDIKPMEFPIQFFLDYAWNLEKWPAERLSEYTLLWAEQQFGGLYTESIAEIISKYTKYNGRRKPELLSPDTYSLINYHEAETVVTDYKKLAVEAERIFCMLPSEYRDAYYQLVLYPVKACANLNELNFTMAKNYLYAKQGRSATNELAERAKKIFALDSEFSRYYHEVMADGKWKHIMNTPHIGYTNWKQPKQNIMPEVKEIKVPDVMDMGISIEGSDSWLTKEKKKLFLPEFDPYNRQSHYFEIFNRGKIPFDYKVQSPVTWLIINPIHGKIKKGKRIDVKVDWQLAPTGKIEIPITITGPDNKEIIIYAVINNPEYPRPDQVKGFIESNGYISMEAVHYTNAVNSKLIQWNCIPDLGRTLSAVTPFPVTASSQKPGGKNPCLEYHLYLFNSSKVRVQVYLSPTLDFYNNEGLRYAVSFDNQSPQIVNIHSDESEKAWEKVVSNNVRIHTSEHTLDKSGEHILKYWMVDAGVILHKIVVWTGTIKESYLGPPESYCQTLQINK